MYLSMIALILTVVSLILSNVKLKQRVKELEEMLEKQNTEQSEKEKP